MSSENSSCVDIRDQVSQRYGQIAQSGGACCCGPSDSGSIKEHGQAIGYSEQDLASLPDGANLGLGCGSPTSLTLIAEGMTVLDLGSGAGVDCFIAAKKVGPSGRVIGVDMTDAMLEKARRFAADHGYDNVEFRKGVIEDLPIDDNCVDLVISNCVVNLSPQKPRVFAEIERVLKPGGQAAISDIVLLKELPEAITQDLEAYIGCISGAVLINEYLAHTVAAGLNIAKADRKGYDVLSVLGCSPEAGKLLEKLPKDFDGAAHVSSLDLLAVKPTSVEMPQSSCCSGGTC